MSSHATPGMNSESSVKRLSTCVDRGSPQSGLSAKADCCTSKDPEFIPGASPGSRAFTLIELVVVLFILLLVTAAVVPRVIALQKSRRLKDLEARIIRLPAEAGNEAVRSGTPVRLRVDGTALILERAPLNGTPEEVKRLALGSGIQVDSVEQGGQVSNTGSWQWTIYPDGSADNGGIQFTEGGAEKSLLLWSDGAARWATGGVPDGTPDRWPAGQLQQHTETPL